MKLLRQTGIIIGICFLGALLQKFLNIPVPGNIIGMMILFICLCTGMIKLDAIKEISNFLLNYLAFFFIPAGVGLIACGKILNGHWIAFLAVCFITTVIIMVVSGYSVQLLKRGQSK